MDQSEYGKKQYQKMVEQASPNSHLITDCMKAFLVGGLICCIGQWLNTMLMDAGFSKDDAGSIATITLVFLGVFTTGMGWYSKLGKFAGAGSVVPITGFANSVASPAIEFKKEGYVVGMAAKMFLVAGPVIVYGTMTSVVVGIFYYFTR